MKYQIPKTPPEQLARAKQRHAALRAQGLCLWCRKPSIDRCYCLTCYKKMAVLSKKHREKRREAGLCTRCKRPGAVLVTKNCCQQCRKEMVRREVDRQRRRKERGLCSKCGKFPLSTASYCEGCTEKHNARQLKKYHRKKKEAA